jgi:hypothetical protein
MSEKFLVGFLVALGALAYIGLSFLTTAGLLWLILWCFGKAVLFTWKIACGVWLVLIAINLVRRGASK